jgi:hypothetical protein
VRKEDSGCCVDICGVRGASPERVESGAEAREGVARGVGGVRGVAIEHGRGYRGGTRVDPSPGARDRGGPTFEKARAKSVQRGWVREGDGRTCRA